MIAHPGGADALRRNVERLVVEGDAPAPFEEGDRWSDDAGTNETCLFA